MSRGTPKRQGKKDGVICDDASKREGEGGRGRGNIRRGERGNARANALPIPFKVSLAGARGGGREGGGDWGIVNT